MNSKLTLNISTTLINKAKKTAKRKNISLAEKIENLLEKATRENTESDVDYIIRNAPARKTKSGEERIILEKELQKKYGK